MTKSSMVGGDESTALPYHSIVDVLSLLHMHFGLVPECWFLPHVQYFRIDRRHKNCTPASVFNKAILSAASSKTTKEEDNRRI